MKINELTYDEQLALTGLVKIVLMSDEIVSASEIGKLKLITLYTGEQKFRNLLDLFIKDFSDISIFRDFLLKIKKQDARELIYATVFEIALSESIDVNESELLDWLAVEWEIEVKML